MDGVVSKPEFARLTTNDSADIVDCFHCGQVVPTGVSLNVRIDNHQRAMCCHGCLAVAQAIIDTGHQDYYRTRTAMPVNPDELIPGFIADPQVYNRPSLRDRYVHTRSSESAEMTLTLEGVTCSACVWLIERHLLKHEAIVSASINYVTRRAQISWHPSQATPADIVTWIGEVGYRATPYKPARHQAQMKTEYSASLKRLVVAGIFGMQIMILAVGLYLADGEMDARYVALFHWASLALCAPILLYSAAPFFQAAWRGVAHWQLGMDVPVSVGISIAFVGSVYACLLYTSDAADE